MFQCKKNRYQVVAISVSGMVLLSAVTNSGANVTNSSPQHRLTISWLSVQITCRPSFRRWSNPASFKILRWCETVGCVTLPPNCSTTSLTVSHSQHKIFMIDCRVSSEIAFANRSERDIYRSLSICFDLSSGSYRWSGIGFGFRYRFRERSITRTDYDTDNESPTIGAMRWWGCNLGGDCAYNGVGASPFSIFDFAFTIFRWIGWGNGIANG